MSEREVLCDDCGRCMTCGGNPGVCPEYLNDAAAPHKCPHGIKCLTADRGLVLCVQCEKECRGVIHKSHMKCVEEA